MAIFNNHFPQKIYWLSFLLLLSHSISAQNYEELISNGLASQKQQDFIQSNLFFSQAIRSNPRNPKGFALRGENYLSMFCYELALRDFEQLVALDPDKTWGIGKRGFSKIKLGRYQDAVSDFERFLHLDSRSDYPFLMLAEAKYKAIEQHKNFAKPVYSYFSVVEAYSQAIQRNPKNAFALRQRALARLDSASISRVPPTIEELSGICEDLQHAANLGDKEAAALIPLHCKPEAMLELIGNRQLALIKDAIYEKQNFKAKELLQQAFASIPESHLAHIEARFISGQLHFKEKQYWKAIDDYKVILENRSPMPERYLWNAHYGTALCLAALQDYRRALQEIDKAIALGYQSSWVYYEKGIIYDMLGEKTEACENWRKSLELGSLAAYEILKERGCKGRFRKPK